VAAVKSKVKKRKTRLGHVHPSHSLFITLSFKILFNLNRSKQGDHRSPHTMYLFFLERVLGTTLILLSLGLNTENSSPTRNGYKVRSYQVALAAIHQHDEPIRSGKDAIKVRYQYPSRRTTFHTALATRCRAWHRKSDRLLSAGQRTCLWARSTCYANILLTSDSSPSV
jgi:hypothetical protein